MNKKYFILPDDNMGFGKFQHFIILNDLKFVYYDAQRS